MMIAIPNMEKPKSCNDCLFQMIDGDFVRNEWLTIESCLIKDDEADDCPLIEIDEPKVGKWIDHKEIIYTDPEIWGYSQECLLCGFTLGAKEYNYCPNCGAKMERRADDNTD